MKQAAPPGGQAGGAWDNAVSKKKVARKDEAREEAETPEDTLYEVLRRIAPDADPALRSALEKHAVAVRDASGEGKGSDESLRRRRHRKQAAGGVAKAPKKKRKQKRTADRRWAKKMPQIREKLKAYMAKATLAHDLPGAVREEITQSAIERLCSRPFAKVKEPVAYVKRVARNLMTARLAKATRKDTQSRPAGYGYDEVEGRLYVGGDRATERRRATDPALAPPAGGELESLQAQANEIILRMTGLVEHPELMFTITQRAESCNLRRALPEAYRLLFGYPHGQSWRQYLEEALHADAVRREEHRLHEAQMRPGSDYQRAVREVRRLTDDRDPFPVPPDPPAPLAGDAEILEEARRHADDRHEALPAWLNCNMIKVLRSVVTVGGAGAGRSWTAAAAVAAIADCNTLDEVRAALSKRKTRSAKRSESRRKPTK